MSLNSWPCLCPLMPSSSKLSKTAPSPMPLSWTLFRLLCEHLKLPCTGSRPWVSPLGPCNETSRRRSRTGTGEGGRSMEAHGAVSTTPYPPPSLVSSATGPLSSGPACYMLHMLTAPQKIFTHHLFLFLAVKRSNLAQGRKVLLTLNYIANPQYIL